MAQNILNNKQDSEECVNDAYLVVWNKIPPERPDRLLSYVCTIVQNLALKKYHANTAQMRNNSFDVALDEIADCIPSSISVENEVAVNEVSAMINGFLETLDKKDRIMFMKRYWCAESVKDIAEAFGTGSRYVSVRLFRVRKALKKYLIKEGFSL